MADELGSIFENELNGAAEIAKLFYYPFQKSTKTRKSVNTGGAFYEKYLNFRQKLITYDIIKRTDQDQECLYIYIFVTLVYKFLIYILISNEILFITIHINKTLEI